jgi:hypothetical protein
METNSLLFDILNRIKKAWFVIVLLGIIGGVVGYIYKGMENTTYEAKSLFYPDKEATLTGSPLELIQGGTAGRAGFLGIFAKILASRYMTNNIARHKITDERYAKYGYVYNWIVDDLNQSSKKPWRKANNYLLQSEDKRIEVASGFLRNGCFAVFDENGFMSLTNHAGSADLALYINKIIIDELIKFNYDKKTEKAKNDLEYFTKRTDSLGKLYESIRFQFANYNDNNKFIIKSTVNIPREELAERRDIIKTRYFKMIEAQEQAFIRFETDKPVVQILDAPFISAVTSPSKSTGAIMYAVFGICLGLILALRKLIYGFVSVEFKKLIKPKGAVNNESL